MKKLPIPLDCFESRYTLRHPGKDDLPDLVRLEQVCWPPGLQCSQDLLRHRIETGPENHCILVIDDRIVGAIYSQRIHCIDDIYQHTFQTVSALHDPDGTIVHLLAVNVIPSMQYLGLGDQLLEFMLLMSSLKKGVRKVMAVTRCKDYILHPQVSLGEYIALRTTENHLIDPILEFHEHHGAMVKGLVLNYRPEDKDNHGHGVLVEYDIIDPDQQVHKALDCVYDLDANGVRSNNGAIDIENSQDLAQTILDAVSFILKNKKIHEKVDPKTALHDLGMDSLDLFGLRMILMRKLNTDISPTLFYKCSSPEAIINYFNHLMFESSDSCEPLPICQTESVTTKVPAVYTDPDAIAVIGMACRFPGGADIDGYWNMLYQGKNSITEVASDRWDRTEFIDRLAQKGINIDNVYGGFLERIADFDPYYFGIAPKEAEKTDPQHRLLLELHHDALEFAGIDPFSLKKTSTGIYVGMFGHDYESLLMRHQSWQDYNLYYSTGNNSAMAAGRLAYTFGTQGPAMTVETACSSSLVAVHMACQALKRHECKMALASGVNLILCPETSLSFFSAGMLSLDGTCKTFDESANGYVRSEGCGVLVLTRLSDALKQNCTIYAVISGSAVNQDGASNGLTAPNGQAQVALYKTALANAGLTPEDISYIEAHGTGTQLGDPIEFESLCEVFGNCRRKHPLVVGSVKTAIGHTEAAAGMAGLIKVILAINHGYIPAHLHFKRPNRLIDFARIPAIVPTQGMPWPDSDPDVQGFTPRYAGVSSFGFSGTNAHVIVSEYKPQALASHSCTQISTTQNLPEKNDRANSLSTGLLTLSARDQQALTDVIASYKAFLSGTSSKSLPDICYTSHVGRTHHKKRLAVLAKDNDDLLQKLSHLELTSGQMDIFCGTGHFSKIAFCFTGQGSQYAGMARMLYDSNAIFRSWIDRCGQILSSYLDIPLLELLFPRTDSGFSALDQTVNTQPALFCIEYALARVWMSWGIYPDFMMGHSVGEYVAACLAGIFSLEDGLKLIAHRARLMQSLPPNGKMLAILDNCDQVCDLIQTFDRKIDIAAFNGPENTVVSGLTQDIDRFYSFLDQKQIKAIALNVSHAFHSYLTEPILESFAKIAQTITYDAPQKAIVSNVTGEPGGLEMATPKYWVDHIRQPVRFRQSIDFLIEKQVNTMLEIGPKPILINMAKACVPPSKQADCKWLASLTPKGNDIGSMARALGALYASGINVDWNSYHHHHHHQRIALPTYPYQWVRCWIDTNASKRSHGQAKDHPLLGNELSTPLEDRIFISDMGQRDTAYLKDHRLGAQILMPAAGFLEIALAAGKKILNTSQVTLSDFDIKTPLVLDPDMACQVQTIVNKKDNQVGEINIYSRSLKAEKTDSAGHDAFINWNLHACLTLKRAGLTTDQNIKHDEKIDTLIFKNMLDTQPDESRKTFENPDPDQNPDMLWLGPKFRGLLKYTQNHQMGIGQIHLPPELMAELKSKKYLFHPALLDACFQTAATALLKQMAGKNGHLNLRLFGIDQFEFLALPESNVWCQVDLASDYDPKDQVWAMDLKIINPDGTLVALAKGVNFKHVTTVSGNRCYRTRWIELQDHTKERLTIGPDKIKEELETAFGQKMNQAEYLDYLEGLSQAYARRALESLGWRFDPSESIDFDSDAGDRIMDRLNITLKHCKLAKRLIKQLSLPDCMAFDQKFDFPGQKTKSFLESIKPELTVLERCGQNLAAVFRGTCDPISLLFPEADVQSAADLYEKSMAFGNINQIIGKVIDSIFKDTGHNIPLRIVEIGAGTGGTTAHVLPMLFDRQVEYVFTDVSTLFLRNAKNRFAKYPFMQYRLLDIESDPVSQGFETGFCDIVIAANVLHATRHLSKTLENVRTLLKQNGLLILVEGTAARTWIDLIFGLIDGWWKFGDKDLRPDYPLLSDAQWMQLLPTCGFNDSTHFSPFETDQALFPQSIIVARAGDIHTPANVSNSRKHCLVLMDRRKKGQPLIEYLTQKGHTVTMVLPDQNDRLKPRGNPNANPDIVRIDPVNADDWSRVVTQPSHLDHILFLWGLDVDGHQQIDGDGLKQDLALTCGGLLNLCQALIRHQITVPAGINVITHKSQMVLDPDMPNPITAPMWALVDVIQKEHPELGVRIADLDDISSNQDGAQVWEMLFKNRLPLKTAVRNQTVLVPQLEKAPIDLLNTFRANPDATYMVTGGLGDIGLTVAKHLVQKKARNIVLVGRRPPNADAAKIISEMQAMGATVKVINTDVSHKHNIDMAIHTISADMPPLKGVIHAAGQFQDQLIAKHSYAYFEQVFGAKVMGSWFLHQATSRLALDFFILFSSAMTFLPNYGLANYTAANAFMDTLAMVRQKSGMPGVSIAWGPWQDTGMARQVSQNRKSQWAAFGLQILPVKDCLDILDHYLCRQGWATPHVGVLNMDWQAFERHFSGNMGDFYNQMAVAGSRKSKPISEDIANSNSGPKLTLDMLVNLLFEERTHRLTDWIRHTAASVMGYDDPSCLDTEDGFFQQGMDSLTAVELRSRIQTELGCVLPTTAIFKHPSVKQLAIFIEQTFISKAILPDREMVVQNIEPTLESDANVAHLSEAEVELSIESELAALETLLNSNE